MAINSNVWLYFFHFHPDDDWSIQSKCWQVTFRTQVGNRQPTCHWRSKVSEDCSPCLLITVVQQPGTSNPPWMCRASFTNSSCPLSWSSGSGGGSPTHALLQRLLHHLPHIDIPVLLQSCLQSPFGLSDVDLTAATGDTICHIGLLTKR